MSQQPQINPLAQELNDTLSSCIVGRLLSDLGTRMYFPKGIIAQSGEAKKFGKVANATIGMAVKNGKPLILSSLQDQLPSLSSAEAVGYPPTAGNEDLRTTWLDSILKKNPSLAQAKISLPVLVPGLTAGISYLSDLFLSNGDILLTGNPAWDNYILVVEARRNAVLKTFELFNESGFNIDSFQTAVMEQAKTGKVRMLLNFPHNPSGYTPTIEETKKIVAVILQAAQAGADVLVWNDDAYFGLDYEPNIESESLFAKLANLHEKILAVKIDGPTKEDYVWGLRAGFLTFGSKGLTEAQTEALIKKLMGIIRSSVSCSAAPSQSLMTKTLADPRTETEKEQFRLLLEQRYRLVRAFIDSHKDHKVLKALPFNSGYFMCMKCNGISSEELRQELLHKHGIGTIAIDNQHLRVAFSSVDTEKINSLFETIFKVAEQLAH